MTTTDTDLVVAFNDAINRADLDGLSALMADGHRFVDSAGTEAEGKAACLLAWSDFFTAFPDYRNVFHAVANSGPGWVVATGRSECTVDALDGPARWHAHVVDGLVVEWRVEDPARDNVPSRHS